MITEDYVSFETAKLLKEKGFDENCIKVYINKELRDVITKESIKECTNCFNHYLYPGDAAAPTLQMVMKWLREEHNICIVIQPYDSYYKERYEFEINKKNNNDFTWEWISDIENTIFDTYEEAVEAALKYCLTNLI